MIGAAAMCASSLLVVGNSLTINLFRDREFAKKNDNKDLQNQTKEDKKTMKTTTLIKIEGMMCPHCSGRVKGALEKTEGVISADVSHERGDAIIEHTDSVGRAALVAVVVECGYKVVG